jgi:site-specific recombinase XerD
MADLPALPITELAVAPDPAQNPAAVYLASLTSAQSRRTMRRCLATLAAMLLGRTDADPLTLTWQNLSYAHSAALRTQLAERYAPATANKHLAALRGVLQMARRLGLMSADAAAAASDVKGVSGSTLPAGRMLSTGEQRALLAACADGTLAGVRDAALIALLLGCGLRRAELVALDVGDVGEEGVVVRSGKGRKQRVVPLPSGTRHALEDWLTARRVNTEQLCIYAETAPLFLSLDRRPQYRGKRITDQTVLTVVLRRAAQAGVADLSPHDFRRTYLSQLLDLGVDLSVAQQLAGHASITTTARYDRRGEAARRRAADLLHVPYVHAPSP